MSLKTVYFARHGEAQANADGLLAGAKIDSPLTAKGEVQAHELARQLVGLPIEFIASSPLSRAHKTAEIIASDIGYGNEIETLSLLIERDFGNVTNTPRATAFAALDSGTAEGVESISDFGRRARTTLQWLKTVPADTVLLVSHAGFGQMLGTVAAGGTPADFLQFDGLNNGGMFTFTIQS